VIKINYLNTLNYIFSGVPFNAKKISDNWKSFSVPSFPLLFSAVSGALILLPQLHIAMWGYTKIKEDLHWNDVVIAFAVSFFAGTIIMVFYNAILFFWTGLSLKFFGHFSKDGVKRILYFSTTFQCLLIIVFISSYFMEITFYSLAKFLIIPVLLFSVLRLFSLYLLAYRECKKMAPSIFIAVFCPDAWLSIYASYDLFIS